jgi:Secretion system C-terminal sorting domain
MRKILHLLLLITITVNLQAQKDTINYIGAMPQQDITRPAIAANVTIYPVPVRENNFTIKTDREISLVRITNIIGQDIFRVKYNDPEQQIRILLDNPKRGMYLVTINFSDGTRVVKKIMIEESE